MNDVYTAPATADRWNDVVAVMAGRGDPSRCWCQFFCLRGQDWRTSSPTSNRALLHTQVRDTDPPPAVIAYVDGEPAGWCAVAPKASYPRVVASPTTGSDTEGIWSVTCFIVKVGRRRQGVTAALLEAAVELARASGAVTVEAYPVDPSARRSVSADELYHGTVPTFLAAGFTEINRPSPARAVVQLRPNPPSKPIR